jgi:hypothetical protein
VVSKRRQLVAAIVLAVLSVVGLAAWLARDPFEPRFNGRRDREVVLSIWDSWITNRQVDYSRFDSLGPERSVQAMLKLYASYRPSLRARWGGKVAEWWIPTAAGTWPALDDWVTRSLLLASTELSAEQVQRLTVRSLEHFGPAASPAVPLLMERLVAEADQSTIKTLGSIGPAAAPSLPTLRNLAATTSDLWFVYAVADSLRRIEPGSEVAALPVGFDGLASPNERVRGKAAELLGIIGPPAAEALPRLRELRSDSWKMVSEAAEAAIKAITLTNSSAFPEVR